MEEEIPEELWESTLLISSLWSDVIQDSASFPVDESV